MVRFVPINMEGMFRREPIPRIMISSFRPLPRQVFTCAHELGHYWVGHGFTIDELKQADERYDGRPPEEILADSFAATILMPALGLRYALAVRDLNGATLTPEAVYTIACDFGVGYETLIKHLWWGMDEIGETEAKQLLRSSPKSIREAATGDSTSKRILMVDQKGLAATMDTFVGAHIVAPVGAEADPGGLSFIERRGEQDIFQIMKQGTFELHIPGRENVLSIRGTRPNYSEDDRDRECFIGLARYRHLSEEDENV